MKQQNYKKWIYKLPITLSLLLLLIACNTGNNILEQDLVANESILEKDFVTSKVIKKRDVAMRRPDGSLRRSADVSGPIDKSKIAIPATGQELDEMFERLDWACDLLDQKTDAWDKVQRVTMSLDETRKQLWTLELAKDRCDPMKDKYMSDKIQNHINFVTEHMKALEEGHDPAIAKSEYISEQITQTREKGLEEIVEIVNL